MDKLQDFSKALNAWVEKGLFVLGAGICLILFAQVLFRYAGASLGWSEEISRYLLVVITFLGGSVAYKQASFIGLKGIGHRLGPTFQKVIVIGLQILTLGCFTLIAWFGTVYTFKTWDQRWSSLPLPMSIPFVVIPVGAAIFIVHILADIFKAAESRKP
jgi:TRAP-type C4-dicarboxylate transport system permease small subunit